MLQMVEEHKSLWRIKDEYLKDAKTSADIKKFWQKIAKEKEIHIKELGSLIKKYMK